jgi:hypothetical protein
MMMQRHFCCGNCPNYFGRGDGYSVRTYIENRIRRSQCRQSQTVADQDRAKVSYMDFCGVHPCPPMNRTLQLLASAARDKRDVASAQGQVAS